MEGKQFSPRPLGCLEILGFIVLSFVAIGWTLIFWGVILPEDGLSEPSMLLAGIIWIFFFILFIYILPRIFGVFLYQVMITEKELIIRRVILFVPIKKRYSLSNIYALIPTKEKVYMFPGIPSGIDASVIKVVDSNNKVITRIYTSSLGSPTEVIDHICKANSKIKVIS